METAAVQLLLLVCLNIFYCYLP